MESRQSEEKRNEQNINEKLEETDRQRCRKTGRKKVEKLH